jgi:hypothetical protein
MLNYQASVIRLADIGNQEPSNKRAKTERKDMNGVNGTKGSPQDPLERVTEALFSASVEAKVWSVATRALGTVRRSQKNMKSVSK